MKTLILSLFSWLVLMTHVYAEKAMSAEELEKWFESDEVPIQAKINEGELEFITDKADNDLLHSVNELTVTESGIDSGWVSLKQCYKNLDAVPEAEVVYRYRHMRELTILSHKNIANAYIEGQSVQIENVDKGAELCITAQVRIFYQNPDLTFSLVNGPFHRKFLDGYYPYHVTLKIHYPADKLEFVKTLPAPQPGYRVTQSNSSVIIDTVFEGILNTETRFSVRKK